MKAAVLAVLLSVMQASPPVPWKTPNDAAQASAQVKNNGNGNQADSLPAQATAETGGNGPTKENGNYQHSEDTQHAVGIGKLPPMAVITAKRDWADWGSWVFNGLLVIVGGLQIWLLHLTWKTVKRQAEWMKRQTIILADYNRATRDIAIAAQDQAQAAMGVAVPTLMLNEFKLVMSESKSLRENLLCPNLMIGVKNYGQSPAIMKSYAVQFTCEGLPSVLRYPSTLHFDSGTALESGKSMPLGDTGVSPWSAFSNEEAAEIAKGKKTLTVYGCVWYDDVFGSPTRKLTFSKWGADIMSDGGRHVIWIDCDYPCTNESEPPLPAKPRDIPPFGRKPN